MREVINAMLYVIQRIDGAFGVHRTHAPSPRTTKEPSALRISACDVTAFPDRLSVTSCRSKAQSSSAPNVVPRHAQTTRRPDKETLRILMQTLLTWPVRFFDQRIFST